MELKRVTTQIPLFSNDMYMEDLFEQIEWELAEKLMCRSLNEVETHCIMIAKGNQNIYYFKDKKLLEVDFSDPNKVYIF